MKAMIFAAGLGTRLRPLTDHKPKALIEVAGRPLLEWNIRRLISFGYTDIVVNVHYLAEQIEDFIAQNNNFGINIIISDERARLLDTGGGLRKASWFLAAPTREPILVFNADILTYLDLSAMRRCFEQQKHIGALLAVRERAASRRLLFLENSVGDGTAQLCSWENTQTGQVKQVFDVLPTTGATVRAGAFSGVQFIAADVLLQIQLEGVFSIIDLYLNLAQRVPIVPYWHSNDIWADIGKPEQIALANDLLANNDYF